MRALTLGEPDTARAEAVAAARVEPAAHAEPARVARAALARLTEAQAEAVSRRSESLLLGAGAGSGKTSVLVERFACAVIEDGIAPARILAITFTERAAAELRERVSSRLLGMGEDAAARALEGAFVGTFHGFCASLLRAHAAAARVDPRFEIAQERIAGWLRSRAFASAQREFIASGRQQAVDLIAAYGSERAHAITLAVYAALRSKGERRPRLPVGALEGEGAAECVLFDELLTRFADAYEELKRARGALDFDDLELIARELLEREPRVRTATAERFELLMVDEFQDCNARELAIVQALERDNLFTVGDAQQAIYGFRHADVRLFEARREALGQRGASLRLSDNFRSRGEILEFVNAVFAARSAQSFEPLLAAREDEQERQDVCEEQHAQLTLDVREPHVEVLLTSKRGWEPAEPPLARARATSAWREAEARAIAARVYELVRSGEARAGDVGVLLRALGDCEVYEAALRERGLRTVAPAGSFWAREQVRDLLSYLRALANPLDELALFSVLASPLAGISRDALALLARSARSRERGVYEELAAPADGLTERLEEADAQALSAFARFLASERAGVRGRSVSRLLERVLDASGYREQVLASADGERSLANVHKLLAIAREFELREGRDLRGFLDYAARLAEGAAAPEAEAPVASEAQDAVTLLSIHTAKGLEFPIVCVADLGRSPNLSVPELLVDGDRIGLRLSTLDSDDTSKALDFTELAAEQRAAQIAEEDRILYVAMTRARERLILSGAIDLERRAAPREDEPPIAWLVRALESNRELVRWTVNEPSADQPVSRASRAGGAAPRASRIVAPAEPALPRELAERPAPGTDGASAAAEGPALDTLSYSSLSQLERCGYRYYLERVLGLPERRGGGAAGGARGDTPDGGAARARTRAHARTRGVLVHRVLESHAGLAPRPGAHAAATDAEIAKAARELRITTTRAERADVARLLERARAPEGLFERIAAATRVHREYEFAFVLRASEDARAGETLITGAVDVLAHERARGALIVDYKTDRVDAHEDLEAVVEREYALQRLVYALAALRAGCEEVEIVHWFLEREDGCVSVRYAAAQLAELEALLRERIESARARGFVPAEQPHRGLCETCPGRGGMCSWADELTLRESPLDGPAAQGMGSP